MHINERLMIFTSLGPYFDMGLFGHWHAIHFHNKKFSFVCDEASFIKIQTLLNKTNIQQKDFQGLAIALIDKVYIQSKGKALK